jgi:hypothetical protein
MNKRLIPKLLLAAIFSIAAAFITFRFMGGHSTRSPLVGEFAFDAGEVYMDQNTVDVRHTFTLKNRTGRNIEIAKVAATCGSTSATASKTIVAPGDTVDVNAKLTFNQPRAWSEEIILNLGDDGVLTLVMSGTARRRHDFYSAQSSVRLSPTVPQQVVLIATSLNSNGPPAEPSFDSPEGVQVNFKGWRLVHELDESQRRPARWQSQIVLSQATLELPTKAKLTVRPPSGSPISIDLTGRPWST